MALFPHSFVFKLPVYSENSMLEYYSGKPNEKLFCVFLCYSFQSVVHTVNHTHLYYYLPEDPLHFAQLHFRG